MSLIFPKYISAHTIDLILDAAYYKTDYQDAAVSYKSIFTDIKEAVCEWLGWDSGYLVQNDAKKCLPESLPKRVKT